MLVKLDHETPIFGDEHQKYFKPPTRNGCFFPTTAGFRKFGLPPRLSPGRRLFLPVVLTPLPFAPHGMMRSGMDDFPPVFVGGDVDV